MNNLAPMLIGSVRWRHGPSLSMRLSNNDNRKRSNVYERGQSPSSIFASNRTKIQMSFGSPLPNSFGSILRIRMPSPQHQRDCLLGHRFNQAQLTSMGLLDGTAEPEKLIETCKELALREGPRVGWGVWGIIKVCLSLVLSLWESEG
jgi:hypothetical protein